MTDHTQLRKLAEAATPGPWYVQYGDDATHMCMTAISHENKRERNMGQFVDGQPLIAITLHQSFPHVDPDCENDEANSAFIAAANPQAVIELLDENERLKKDAERYRWLRHGDNDELVLCNGPIDKDYWYLLRAEKLDAAIDATMEGKQSQNKLK